jgi:hypothetical protein
MKVNNGVKITMNQKFSDKVRTRRSVWRATDVKEEMTEKYKILAFYETG